MMYKTKKGAFLVLILILSVCLSLMLYSCDKPDEDYCFNVEFNIKINEDYLNDAMPDELDLKINGMVKGGNLYVEVNDVSRIILDLLISTELLDAPVKTLFDGIVEYDNDSVLVFDLSEFDFNVLDGYIKSTEKIFTVKSSFDYDFETADYDEDSFIYFSDIKTKIAKELLKLPGYRYSELYIVLETDKDNNNFINILATNEKGETKILDKVKIDCDLSAVREKPESVFTENILPMRYLLELLGETVEWDDTLRQAYIIKNERKIYFEGSLINSKTYINAVNIMLTDFNINFVSAGEYIEIRLTRKK